MRRAQRFAQLPTQTHQASGQQPQGLPLRRGHDAFHEKRIHEEEEELIKEVLREHAYDLTFRQLKDSLAPQRW